MNLFLRLFLSLQLVGLFVACQEEPDPNGTDSASILFIGNSYTYYNTGLDNVLLQMIEAARPSGEYMIESSTQGGYTLQDHYSDATTQSKLLGDRWDYVVLQEQSTRPINDPDAFNEYAEKLDRQIDSIGAQSTLFMTWARSDDPSKYDVLEAAYTDASINLTAKLAPVGKAWEYSLSENPLIALHDPDKSHPTAAGTYLSACIFYIVLFEDSPVGNSFAYGGLSESTRATLQQTAEEFMANY